MKKRCLTLPAAVVDINALRMTEPDMHVVFLTHHLGSFKDITDELNQQGYTVFGVSSTVDMKTRQGNIIRFQESADRGQVQQVPGMQVMTHLPSEAKVLVATMKIGNVGITLTAASRVYLYEPCLDPQMEVQAAGRIHRLGQTRSVLVKRLVFRDSVESCIVSLHEAIKAGQMQIKDGLFPNRALTILNRQ